MRLPSTAACATSDYVRVHPLTVPFVGPPRVVPQDRVYMEQRISDYFVQHLVKDPPPQVLVRVGYTFCVYTGTGAFL